MSATIPRFEVLIVGAGPVGATLGALLIEAAPRYAGRIALLDRELPEQPLASAAHDPAVAAPALAAAKDLRVVALSRASERVLRTAGAWDEVAAGSAQPYRRMHVWPESVEPRSSGALSFDAAELAEPDLGAIVENRSLQSAAVAAFRRRGGQLLQGEPRALHFENASVRVDLRAGETLCGRLLVGADGARSSIRALAGLPAEAQDYAQLALVANVRCERAHEETAWQRFLGDGTLALLPLASGECSIVWSLPVAAAHELLAASAGEFSTRLTEASAGVLGRLELASERLSFPLRRIDAAAYTAERCALVGDAAHVVHPLAGQGVNLGLLDAAALAETLASDPSEDPGALRLLRRYERWRRSENELMAGAMDLFNRFLAFGRDPAGRFAQRALGWVDASAALKRLFVERAMGLAGDLPVAAMPRPRRP